MSANARNEIIGVRTGRQTGAKLIAFVLTMAMPALAQESAKTVSSRMPRTLQQNLINIAAAQKLQDVKPGRGDFDFEKGDWQVENRRQVKPLDQNSPWETFTASVHMDKLPGGVGNVDSFAAPGWRPDWLGMALRLFNGETGLWSIFLLDTRNGGLVGDSGRLDTPLIGKFEHGIGIFEADDVIDGVPIRCRFTWNIVDADHPKWQQEFSFDGGKTWKPNWYMAYVRVKK